MNSKLHADNIETERGNPLRGFWNRRHAKPGPCISRPDLVAERNASPHCNCADVAQYGPIISGHWFGCPEFN